MTYVLLVLVVLVGGLMAYVRFAPNLPGDWHDDPLTVTERGADNSFLAAPGGDAPALHLTLPPDQVAARLDAIASATPRTELLAGEGFHKTWITRTKWWGFPDFTSVRLIAAEDGGTDVALFARSRFGKSDLGVNRARALDWLAQLQR
ncbi:DUF1499 domain-containing protein [Cereibacter sphaeroides]|nr:DUF1499 domain-containing protein [Rhodobacter sp. CZR27]MCE6952847.1 DUF1499 domain-containing protein [Cereibacter sphaeroides]MCE6962055.1 DUF1499 domain-containing protein [Cereibacter sphaeroides]MCE6970830.1 DUF1499 domain-containing protein [Cereibacter sphaeroides]MCE6975574.1 DUF1499 domain-containing protein [Cereibacter sphaeroides]